MRKTLLFIVFFYGTFQTLYSQDKENGVVSFSLPVRNSLKFNRYLINPTFSFVREQNTTISFYNKRQWIQFENAPQTYLASYSGRFGENEGMAIGLFQQNYGVLTTFGGVVNFAHNVMFQEDSNLTFGLNLGFYKSGLNKSNVITYNQNDPSLENIPSNSLLTLNPGINYGIAFLDFGVSANNLILYNFNTSKIVEDDPEKSIEAHIMHTGYLDTYGFFDRSKFSALLKTEFKKDKTVISGLMMLAIPKGIWAQAGYNTLYGMSGGIGLNLTSRIALEYNFEKGTGNFSNFGSSHEIVFAYKFKSNNYYYGDDDEEGAIISPAKPKKKVVLKPKESSILSPIDAQRLKELKEAVAVQKEQRRLEQIADAKAIAENQAKADAVAQAKLVADAKAKADAAAQAKLVADAKAKADAVAQTKLVGDAKAKADAAAQAKLVADAKAKADAVAQAKLVADAKIKADAAAQAKLVADAKAKADAAAQAKLVADAKAKADAVAQAQLVADAKIKADAVAKAKLVADAQAKADAAAQAKLVADAQAKADAVAQAKQVEDAKAKSDAVAQAKLVADAQAKADAAAQAKLVADAQAKADAVAQAKQVEDAQAKADAAAQAKLVADAQAKADAAAQAKLVADAKAKADAIAQAKLVADAQAKADAAAQAKLVADAQAKADAKAKADAAAQAKLVADAQAKADAAAQAKLVADAKAKADAVAQAKQVADAKAKADAAAQAKLVADAQAKADAAAKLAAVPKDDNAKAMDNLSRLLEQSKNTQKQLLAQLDATVTNKEKDLRDLKEENDLSEKGIFKDPKPFKSISAENSALESLKTEIAEANKNQNEKIRDLDNLYKERLKKVPNSSDAINQSYLNTIEQLKAEQLVVIKSNMDLLSSLEKIKVETEIEKKRRIKRASFVGDQGRYLQDLTALNRIKESTKLSTVPLKAEDFDYGEEQSNMQILKNIKNVEGGYYLIIAVHNDVAKRDSFLTKVVSAGQSDINFFYDVNSSNYFIYYDKFDNLQAAQAALGTKGNKPFNGKMSIVKIE